MKTILKLSEPNGNNVWINVDQLACMYRKAYKSPGGEESIRTAVFVGAVEIPVTETPDEILDMIDKMMRAAGYSSATIGP